MNKDNANEQVVKLSYLQENIAVVCMEDRESKNTFSHRFVSDLLRVFGEINNNPCLKTVVIHGYDSYFCCGGTTEELLEIQEGKKVFTDYGSYRLFLECPVPVIAAMQGHALGGGLAFAAYADMFVIAEEAFYSANFMKYGFTPGFGATYLIPRKFGMIPGGTMLFDAKNHQGLQLKQWGVSAQFARKNEVIQIALNLAREIAAQPRENLILLKQQLTREHKMLMPNFIESELAMHAISFRQEEVKDRINKFFINNK